MQAPGIENQVDSQETNAECITTMDFIISLLHSAEI